MLNGANTIYFAILKHELGPVITIPTDLVAKLRGNTNRYKQVSNLTLKSE
jgi:hypothetical protein